MNTKYIQKIMALALVFLFSIATFAPVALASGRDCDSNAIIYCGTLSKDELERKLKNGTGKTNQSSTKLKALFGKYGFEMSDIPKLRSGRVTSGNNVYVGTKKVAKNVYVLGRHKIGPSTRVADLSYPVYRRHPSVSFNSSSLDAYVYLNKDGSMAYAIIKSCGNIVEGVGKPMYRQEAPAPATYTLTVRKWNDINANGSRDANEAYLPNWRFRIQGNGIDEVRATNSAGTISRTGLLAGTYTVTEYLQSGWRSTTGITQRATLGPNQMLMFGNQRIPTYSLTVRKWNDINANGTRESSEPYLPNWRFRIVGNGVDEVRTTNSAGTIVRYGLRAGNYTVSEVAQTGWIATTNPSRHVTLGPNQTVLFGNRREVNLVGVRVYKFEDINSNRVQDDGEPALSGWRFRVTGNGTNREIVTDANGYAELLNIPQGQYIVEEINIPTGWTSTTGATITRTVTDNVSTQIFIFGNNQTTREQFNLRILKFNDVNSNRVRDDSEEYLYNWEFRIQGPDYEQSVFTDEDGEFLVPNLRLGNYIVTEVLQDGWENTTGLSIQRMVTDNASTHTFVFGNRERSGNDITPNPGGGDTVRSLPVSGMKENIAIAVAIILSLCMILYFASRFYLKMVMVDGRPPTDPRQIIKALRKRAIEKKKQTQKSHRKILKAENKFEKDKKRFKKEHGL